jgi:GNAT superfamily N-acetyltransferase
VVVRDATPDDLPDLIAMWGEHRDLVVRADRALPSPTAEAVLDGLQRAAEDPDVRIVLAECDGAIAGVAVLTYQPLAALFTNEASHLHYLHVRPDFRRRGVGHALVGAAADFAEQRGADQVITSVVPQLRESNRFYARLGFAPMVVQRIVSVPVLRRRLASSVLVSGLDQAAVRRRSVQARSRVRKALARVAE